MAYRFHLPNLPHTQLSDEYSWCAYTQKVRRFADMMISLGHEVFVYGSEDFDCAGTEYIPCISKEEQAKYFKERIPEFRADVPGFDIFNVRVAKEMEKRYQGPEDFFANIAGHAFQPMESIAHAHGKPTIPVEWGIGYEGIYCDYLVFESYAWMHTVYGYANQSAARALGRYYDGVIPNSWHPHEFPSLGKGDGGYLFFMGRLIQHKGLDIIAELASRIDIPIKVAGQGDVEIAGVEMLGFLLPHERDEIMRGAMAVLTPTNYLDPFCGVHVEAMMTGTPVITSDWGVFPETVRQGQTGWRCRTLGEYEWAANNVADLDRAAIREYAFSRFSTDVTKHQYQDYFDRVIDLKRNGWFKAEIHRPTAV